MANIQANTVGGNSPVRAPGDKVDVTFIHPSNVYSDVGSTFMVIPPIGMAYVAAVARQHGLGVEVVDSPVQWRDQQTAHEYGKRRVYASGGTFEQIEQAISPETKIIGVTCMFMHQWPWVRDLIKHIRSKRPDVFIVIGGEQSTGGRKQALEDSPIDCVVRGEGEEIFAELANRVVAGEPWSECSGISYLKDGVMVDNPSVARIKDIDAMPLPAWDLFDLEPYFENRMFHGPSSGRSIPIVATRGCPYQCTFCTSPQMWTTRWYARDPKLVADEMALYIERYNVNDFQFTDLTAVLKRDWILAFSEELISRGWDHITWQLPSGTRSEAIDKEVAQKMRASGCLILTYAPESGAPTTLARIKKRVKKDRMIQSIRDVRSAGLRVECFFIIGLPQESLWEIAQTILFFVKLAWYGVTSVIISGYRPVPGTEMSAKLERDHGLVWDDQTCIDLVESSALFGGRSYNPRFSHRHIVLFRLLGYSVFFGSSFLFRPWRPFRLLWNVLRGNQTSKLDKALIEMTKKYNRINSAQVAP